MTQQEIYEQEQVMYDLVIEELTEEHFALIQEVSVPTPLDGYMSDSWIAFVDFVSNFSFDDVESVRFFDEL